MVAQRGTPTVGPDPGVSYAGSINTEVQALWNGVISALTVTGGTGDAVTATCAAAPLTAYAVGQGFSWYPTATNTTTTPGINVDSRGNKTIVDQDGASLPPGKIVIGRLHFGIYDGTFIRLVGVGALVRFPIFIEGKPSASEKVMALVMSDSVSFPAGMALSLAKAGAASTGTVVFTINKNGAQFAKVTFTASATGVVASSPASPAVATGFVAGDVLSIVAPAGIDPTLQDISITLAATH